MTTPRRLLALALVATAGAGVLTALPAAAHNPRDTPEGAPRMDLEVMVTPELQGRITPGGTDPVVSVDGFGNRFVVARKEDAQTLVGVDPRARAAARASAWAWTSEDHGQTWTNLDVLPRGAEQLVPQSVSRDVTSNGPLTLIVENHGAASVVHVVRATGRGRLTATPQRSRNPLPGAVGSDVSAATNGREAVVVTAPATGPSVVSQIPAGGTVATSGASLPGRCDVAADPRPATRTFWAACTDGTLHRSTDGGAAFSKAGSVPTSAERPQVDVGPDGTPYVLSGTRLTRVRAGRPVVQDLALPPGDVRGTSFAVSNRGRVAATAYTRSAPGETWRVQVAMFSPGSKPVWYDFSDHDPVTPQGVDAPPSPATSVDTDPLGRLQMAWTSTFLHNAQVGRPLLRNVFTARSVTS